MAILRILHLEDNSVDAELVEEHLRAEKIECAIHRVARRTDFERAIDGGHFDIIISDFSLPDFDGLTALKYSRRLTPDTPFIFLSGTIGEERAVESLRNGAVDYVLKDRLQRLPSAVLRARQEALARKQIAQSQEMLKWQAHLLNEARDAIFVRDLNQVVTYWNKGAERLYGWISVEILGRKAAEMLYPQGTPTREDIWKAVLQDGEWTGELAQVTKDGKAIWVTSRRTLLQDEKGNPSAVFNINTDITERKELETQILRSQRMDSIGALAAGIAHDLNNVLAPILMANDLLAEAPLADSEKRLLEMTRNSTQRGAALVKQILQFARGSKHGELLVDVKTLATEVANFAIKTFPPNINIHVRLDESLKVKGDPTQLHQVLLNFCVNARDAMPNGGELRIEGDTRLLANKKFRNEEKLVSGSFVELSVTDNGTGIPSEIVDRIFEPFFSTKSESRGTGLGLSTVATIVRNHRGHLEVITEVGSGTTFRVFYPLAEGESEKAPTEDAEPPSGNGECLLLIDDEAALLEMTKQLLEAYRYEVITAGTGPQALQLFEQHKNRIRVVITDLMLPGMGGIDLIGAIRESAPESKIICVSGSTDENAILSSKTGANLFLRKPCPARTLLEALGRLMPRS